MGRPFTVFESAIAIRLRTHQSFPLPHSPTITPPPVIATLTSFPITIQKFNHRACRPTRAATHQQSLRELAIDTPTGRFGSRFGQAAYDLELSSWTSTTSDDDFKHNKADEYKACPAWPGVTVPDTEHGHRAELGIEEIMSTAIQPGGDWSPLSGSVFEIDFERVVPALQEECDRIKTILNGHGKKRMVNDKTDTKFCDTMIATISDY
jgi:hypothetical protein